MLSFVATDNTGHRVIARFETEETAARFIRDAKEVGVKVQPLSRRGLVANGVLEAQDCGEPRGFATASAFIRR